jgi:hypothetical protein
MTFSRPKTYGEYCIFIESVWGNDLTQDRTQTSCKIYPYINEKNSNLTSILNNMHVTNRFTQNCHSNHGNPQDRMEWPVIMQFSFETPEPL